MCLPQAQRTDDGPGLLVPPDGYVRWAGDTRTGDGRAVLAQWVPSGVGPAAPVGVPAGIGERLSAW